MWRHAPLLAAVLLLCGPAAARAGATLGPGTPAAPAPAWPAVIAELPVGDKVYRNVRVRQVTPRAVIFLYDGGLTSVPLEDLPPEWRAKFGYDPAAATAEAARLQAEAEQRRAQATAAPGAAAGPVRAADRVLQRFGQPPKLFAEVNLRPRFELLGIDAKNQGARPSCAVFALVSALEFQQSPPQGPAPRLSEEYLIWATLKTLGQAGVRLPKTETPGFDVGFSMVEVAQALRAHGICLEEDLPYRLSGDNPRIIEPAPGIQDRAKLRSPVNGFFITGREPAVEIANIVQALNEALPVVVGLKWPAEVDLPKNGLLDQQAGRDNYQHAVLFVGYRNTTGRIEDTEFLFKNSYGAGWGDKGYGLATYRYLLKNLSTAFFMDVR